MKKRLLILTVAITTFIVSCQKTYNEEVYPQKMPSSTIISSGKNARPDGEITILDVTPVNFQNRGTVQFQWAGNTASQSWIGETSLLTNTERINILDQAYSKIGLAKDRANFKCAYDRAKADILANKRFPVNTPSYNFVKNCCQTCSEQLNKQNPSEPRCDFQVNKGTF